MKLFLSGGTGTLGHELTEQLGDIDRLVIFSRDEFKQSEMRKQYPEGGERGVRYMLGDVRNESRLIQAMQGCDYVIHAAAMKQVPACEYNPQEAIATNVIGSMNVINACNKAGIKRCIVVSTDKACEPTTHYGSTKLCAEKTAIAANNIGRCRFSVVRYGNVIGSRASVIPLWRQQVAEGRPITMTNRHMTRFWITIQEAARFVLNALGDMQGGEIFVPKMTSRTMEDLAWEIAPEAKIQEIGIRPGEKMHECLVGEEDARDCWDEGARYVIYPQFHEWVKDFSKRGDKMPDTFRYRSVS